MKKIIFLFFIFFLFSCSLLKPKAKIEINIVSEKTSLEHQVLGNYSFIGKNALLSFSVRTFPNDLTKLKNRKKRAMLAYLEMKYNRDDYERFMDMNIIGETDNGYITIVDKKKINENKALLKFVKKLVYEENRDRAIVYSRIIEITEGLTKEDLSKVEEIFAKKYREEAKKGWYIKTPEGKWERK